MFAPELRYYPVSDTRNFICIQSLQGIWKTESGEIYRVPFVDDEKKELTITHIFQLAEKPTDTLWLYCSGLGIETEVYINDRLFDFLEHPFKTQLIPVPARLIQLGENKITLKLGYRHVTNLWGIPGFIGVYRPIYLLKKSSLNPLFQFAASQKSDSCLVYIPMSERKTYHLDFEQFKNDLQNIQSTGITQLFCPFGLQPKFRYYAVKLGFTFVNQLSVESKIALYRLYSKGSSWDGPVWVNPDGKQSKDFGKFKVFSKPKPVVKKIEIKKWELVVLGIYILLVLALFKILNPELFKKTNSIIAEKRLLDDIKDGKYAIQMYSYLLFALKWSLKSIVISMLLMYLMTSGELKSLNVFNNPSLLYSFLEDFEGGLSGILLPVSIGFLFYGISKYLLLYFTSNIYQMKDWVGRQRNLEILSEFPSIWAIYLSTFLYFSAQPEWKIFFEYMMYLTFFIWIVRKFWYTIVGLEQIVRMPYSVVFLYICALEVLPWLLLL